MSKPHVVAWYTPEEFLKVIALGGDPNLVGLPFEKWLQGAQESVKTLEADGFSVTKVHVDAESVLAYARKHGKDVKDKRLLNEFVWARYGGEF